jgi:guanylate kinase
MHHRPLKKARPEAATGANRKTGLVFVISAPSGAGKSTLCRAIRDSFPDLQYSISFTTRPPRHGEQNGVDYHFITTPEFEEGIQTDQWAEWARVHGNYYGTSAGFLDRSLAAGRDIVLDIDIEGTRQILKRHPDSITIFVMPPSMEVLRQRLETRGTDSSEVIAVRLKNADNEIAQKDLYRHVIINERLPQAVAELIAIFEKYRL